MINKKFTLAALTLLSICSIANAILPGVYMGLEAGEGYTNYSLNDGPLSANSVGTTTNTGLAGRLYFGYEFSPYLGLEMGYTQFTNTQFETINNDGNVNATAQQYAIDGMMKLIYPFADTGFSAYGKIGAAYVNEQGSMSNPTNAATSASISSSRRLTPAYALGFTYDINDHVPIDLSWYYMQKSGPVQQTNLYAVGISYYFG